MKKLLLVFFALAMFSCQQDEDIDSLTVPADNTLKFLSMQQRPPSEIADIYGLEVHITQAEANRGDLINLSAHERQRRPYLTKTGNNTWQKWVITKASAFGGTPVGALNIQSCAGTAKFGHWLAPNLKNSELPALSENNYGQFFMVPIVGTNNYKIGYVDVYTTRFLTADKNYKEDDLRFEIETASNAARQAWTINIAEEFELVDISYSEVLGDKVNMRPRSIDRQIITNERAYIVTETVTINKSYSTTSTFSKTEGFKLTTKHDIEGKFGLPVFVNGKISNSMSTENSWSYTEGKTETKSYSISTQLGLTLEPFETCMVDVVGIDHDADITYTAKYRGVTTGKIINLKGKWKGVSVSETKIHIKTLSGVLKRTLNVTPQLIK